MRLQVATRSGGAPESHKLEGNSFRAPTATVKRLAAIQNGQKDHGNVMVVNDPTHFRRADATCPVCEPDNPKQARLQVEAAWNLHEAVGGGQVGDSVIGIVNHLRTRTGTDDPEEHYVVHAGTGEVLSHLVGHSSREIDTSEVSDNTLANNISIHQHPGIPVPHSENDLTNALAVGERHAVVVTRDGVHCASVTHPTDQRDHKDFGHLLAKAERLEHRMPSHLAEVDYGKVVHSRIDKLASQHPRWLQYHSVPHEPQSEHTAARKPLEQARLQVEAAEGWGEGSWVTPEGEKINVPEGKEHSDTIPGGHGVRRYMHETHHARVRCVNGQMNVMISHPLTGKQRNRLLLEADKNKRFSVGITTTEGPSSFVHYEEGDTQDADKILARAHNKARQLQSTARLARLYRMAVEQRSPQGRDVYLRFGDWHPKESSTNWLKSDFTTHTFAPEGGVSVYKLDKGGDPVDPGGNPDKPVTPSSNAFGLSNNDTGGMMRYRQGAAEQAFKNGVWDARNARAHLVTGHVVGQGQDGEPLLKNVRRVGDWIQDRHKFISTAKPHHLALPEGSRENRERQQYIDQDFTKQSPGVKAKLAGSEEGEHTPYPHPVTLYRGLHFGNGSAEDIDRMHAHPHEYLKQQMKYNRGVGIHWTSDPEVAHNFARGRNAWGEPPDDGYSDDEEEDRGSPHGAVLEAHVHPSSVLNPGTKEWQDYADSEGIFDQGHGEQEHTVRDHARVDLDRAHMVSEDDEGGNYRTTSINLKEQHTAKLHTAKVIKEPISRFHDGDIGASDYDSWNNFRIDRSKMEPLRRMMPSHNIYSPVQVGHFPDGSRKVIDGHHRVLLAKELGLLFVPTEHVEVGQVKQPKIHSVVLSASDHDVLYHLTDQHHFSLDPEKAPSDNTFALQDRSGNKGLYVTDNPDRWRANGYHRPYVAEIHVPHGLARDERWGGEKFIPAEHFDKVKVNRVIPFDAHQREKWGEHGTVEDYHGTHYETDEPLEISPFRSGGGRVRVSQEPEAKDVRTITPEEHSRHLLRLREYLHGAKGYGWNEFNDKHEHVGVDEDDSDDEGMPIRRDKSGKPMTMERSATLHTAMNAEDEVPPEMGTAPIPEGHVRLYHHTWASSVPSIREHGLLASMGRGDGGKGPSEPSAGVWASTRHDPPPAEGDRHVVEFHVHPDEIDVNGPNHGRDPKEWNAGDHNVLLKGSVKPENFVAIHSPWHTAYHQMSEPRMRDETLKGQYDNIGEDPQYAHSYGRAITKIKAEGMLHVASAPTFGPEHYDLWKQPKPEWDSNKEWQENHDTRDRWTHSMRRALSLGHLTQEEAEQKGHYEGGHAHRESVRVNGRDAGGWQPMPHDLYHVTTNAPEVAAHGLKSRDELGQDQGVGLGGGESDTISLTDDPKMAQQIHVGVHEMRSVARGEKTPAHMVEEARNPVHGEKPFLKDLLYQHDPDWKDGDPLPSAVHSLVRGRKIHPHAGTQGAMDKLGPGYTPHRDSNAYPTKDGGKVHTMWERPMGEDEKRDANVGFYKRFASAREAAGGPVDPLFFSSDAKGLANVPEHHIQVMRFHPKPGAQGYPVSGMKEWRTASGDAVEPHHEDTTSGGSLAVKREVSMKLAKVASPNDAIHLGTLHYLAHDSGDGATCYHCPFCGSGNIVGRSDGTIECSYCLNHFTVQTQPEFASMPQTIDGQPQQMPGMPGDPTAPLQEPQEAADADSAQPGSMGDPGAQEPAADPSEEPPAGGGGGKPPWLSKLHTAGPSADAYTPTQDTGDVYCRECGGVGQTQVGKSLQDCSSCGGTGFSPAHRRQLSQDLSSEDLSRLSRYYVTASGVALDEDAYTRHLALSFADDHPEVLAQVRRINAAKASV